MTAFKEQKKIYKERGLKVTYNFTVMNLKVLLKGFICYDTGGLRYKKFQNDLL